MIVVCNARIPKLLPSALHLPLLRRPSLGGRILAVADHELHARTAHGIRHSSGQSKSGVCLFQRRLRRLRPSFPSTPRRNTGCATFPSNTSPVFFPSFCRVCATHSARTSSNNSSVSTTLPNPIPHSPSSKRKSPSIATPPPTPTWSTRCPPRSSTPRWCC